MIRTATKSSGAQVKYNGTGLQVLGMGLNWANWGPGGTTGSSESTNRTETTTAASLTLVSNDADAGYPATEYTDGQIVFLYSERQDALLVEYRPATTTDSPPVSVANWALILADAEGAVLASGVITQAGTGLNGIRRYHVNPDQEGPAPPGQPWA